MLMLVQQCNNNNGLWVVRTKDGCGRAGPKPDSVRARKKLSPARARSHEPWALNFFRKNAIRHGMTNHAKLVKLALGMTDRPARHNSPWARARPGPCFELFGPTRHNTMWAQPTAIFN